jgi:hypothetical protein
MNVDVLSIKDKVQRYLTDGFEKVVVDSDGDFSFRIGSTHMWVAVSQVDQKDKRAGYVAVRVFANTNNRVPPSPELFEYVSTQGRFAFGALRCYKKDDGVRVFLEHTLVGDFIDPAELWICFSEMAYTADAVDDSIKSKFGGVLYHEGSK